MEPRSIDKKPQRPKCKNSRVHEHYCGDLLGQRFISNSNPCFDVRHFEDAKIKWMIERSHSLPR